MISLLAPLGLAGLAAWLLPLLIHWVRRSDRQLVVFAAMRYLSEQAHPRERLRLHEPWLLFVRLLLIALLALLLAGPVLHRAGSPSAPWVLVTPGVSAAAARAAVSAPLAEWRWLAVGFPSLEAPLPPQGDVSISSLLRQADVELPPRTAVTLVVPEELSGLDAERVRLAHSFTWRVLPGTGVPTSASGQSGGDGWSGAGADLSSRASAPVMLAVRTDAAGGAELPLVRALAAAWRTLGLDIQWDIAGADAPLPANPSWLIWLAGPLPPGIDAWVRVGGTVFASRQSANDAGTVVLSDASGAPLLRERRLGRGRVLSLAGPLRVNSTLGAAEFPHTLLALMRGPPRAPDRASATEVEPLASGQAPIGPAQPLLPYLAFGVAVLFIWERLLASRARARA